MYVLFSPDLDVYPTVIHLVYKTIIAQKLKNTFLFQQRPTLATKLRKLRSPIEKNNI